MDQQQPALSSNNPFRRKPPAASVPSSSAPPPPPVVPVPPIAEVEAPTPTTLDDSGAPLRSGDQFRNQIQAFARPNQPPPPATSFQKPKVVKKVRVQSPPPSSPESAGVPERFPPVHLENDDDGESESSSSVDTDDQIDPFGYASSTRAADQYDDAQTRTPQGPPPNPFQKTLRDLEVGAAETSQSSGAAAGARNTLDVDAFRRLLLTGQAGNSGPPQATPPQPAPPAGTAPSVGGDGASITDASSTSRQSISDALQTVQETPRTSHETSEQEGDDDRHGLISGGSQSSLQPAPSILRKKPPPPSSRHGKLIKPAAGSEAKTGANKASPTRSGSAPVTSPSRQRPRTPSDVNKPLPPAPLRSPAEVVAENVFDWEAAGKVPEPGLQPGLNIVMPVRPPTPPNASHAIAPAPPAARKPAPPPRRQPHGRSESRTVQQDDADSSIRRSSFDSTRSRSSSLRASVHAPAPPPPRRPSHAPRASSSFSLPPAVITPGSEKNPAESASAVEHSPPSGPIVASPPPLSGTPTPTSSSRASPAVKPVTPAPASLNHYPHSHSPLQPQSPPQPLQTGQSQLHAKISPPPPPPARNPSVRARKRPVSGTLPSSSLLSETGTTTRSVSGGSTTYTHAHPQPPPPPAPPRRRGSSGRGSLDSARSLPGHAVPPNAGLVIAEVGEPGQGPGADVNVNAGGGPGPVGLQAEEGAGVGAGPGAEEDILADLDLLQKEVDALRGMVEGGGGAKGNGR